ncbi:hypothetical protein [Leptospirillum sp. Group II 'CF-1']|nr:hypothetical protein [Leptospirillum sp. Group II 'CF-1']
MDLVWPPPARGGFPQVRLPVSGDTFLLPFPVFLAFSRRPAFRRETFSRSRENLPEIPANPAVCVFLIFIRRSGRGRAFSRRVTFG